MNQVLSPQVDKQSAAEILSLAFAKATEVSEGRLTRFDSSSPTAAILEAVTVIAANQQGRLNNLASDIENNRMVLLGIEREAGAPAIGTITATLDALYSTPFLLPKGFRVTLDGVQFETTADITINAYTPSGTAPIVALDNGVSGNLPISASASFQDVQRLSSITLVDATKGGLDEEPIDGWKSRIYDTIRRRDTLISEPDFESESRRVLGTGSVALCIGRLKPDKVTYANGYVSVFALNPDGTRLTDTQLSSLQSNLSSKASMATVTLWSLDIVPVNITIAVGFLQGSSPDSLSVAINQVVRDYFSPGNLEPGTQILNKAIEARVQGIRGITEGVISVELNGLAQPASLPNLWSVAKVGTFTVTLISSTGQQFPYTL